MAELTEKLQQAEKKIAENYDMYVRAMAEVENTRKRAEADVLKAEKFGIDKFATNLLPVMDSLEKAMEHAQKEEGPMKDGLLAIYRQLVHAMEVSGMKSFEPSVKSLIRTGIRQLPWFLPRKGRVRHGRNGFPERLDDPGTGAPSCDGCRCAGLKKNKTSPYRDYG